MKRSFAVENLDRFFPMGIPEIRYLVYLGTLISQGHKLIAGNRLGIASQV